MSEYEPGMQVEIADGARSESGNLPPVGAISYLVNRNIDRVHGRPVWQVYFFGGTPHPSEYMYFEEAHIIAVESLQATIDRLTAENAELAAALAEAGQALTVYDDAGRKFIAKVESGRAHSRETYTDLCTARDLAAPLIGREQHRAATEQEGATREAV